MQTPSLKMPGRDPAPAHPAESQLPFAPSEGDGNSFATAFASAVSRQPRASETPRHSSLSKVQPFPPAADAAAEATATTGTPELPAPRKPAEALQNTAPFQFGSPQAFMPTSPLPIPNPITETVASSQRIAPENPNTPTLVSGTALAVTPAPPPENHQPSDADSNLASDLTPANLATTPTPNPANNSATPAPDPRLSSLQTTATEAETTSSQDAETPENKGQNASTKDSTTSPAAAEIPHGIRAAQQHSPMKKSADTNKNAAGMKEFPGSEFAPQIDTGEEITHSRTDAPNGHRGETATATCTSLAPLTTAPEINRTSNLSELRFVEVAESQQRILDHAGEMVMGHSLRMRMDGTESLQVVIKPGAGVALGLELQQHGQRIEVQATLQSGDFNQLNQHWAELQQRLEAQGVRLAPLLAGEAPFHTGANGGDTPQQKHKSSEDVAPRWLIEIPAATAPTNTAHQPATPAVRGWETWA